MTNLALTYMMDREGGGVDVGQPPHVVPRILTVLDLDNQSQLGVSGQSTNHSQKG